MVKSTVLIDSTRWTVARCESAMRDGFYGVDLTGDNGDRLRIIPQPDETAQVVLFPNDGGEPIKMEGCAKARMPRSGLKVNSIPAMTGWAELACEVKGRKIEGKVEFERCH